MATLDKLTAQMQDSYQALLAEREHLMEPLETLRAQRDQLLADNAGLLTKLRTLEAQIKVAQSNPALGDIDARITMVATALGGHRLSAPRSE